MYTKLRPSTVSLSWEILSVLQKKVLWRHIRKELVCLGKHEFCIYQNILWVCWTINHAPKPAVFRPHPVCIEMNWCFLNAQLRKEKAHCSLKRAWDWSSLCTACHCIRESCSFWQSDCGPSCKAAIMYFHMQSPLFVQFTAKTINITNVSLRDVRMKATIELPNHQRKYRPLALKLWFMRSWIDLHSNNSLFFILGLRPSSRAWT